MQKKYIITGILVLTVVLLICYFSFSNKKYHFQISTRLSGQNDPSIKVKIQGHKYPLRIDLGSKLELELSKSTLNLLDKTPHKSLTTRDMTGRPYENPAHVIPSIEINGLVFDQVVTIEENVDYISNTTFYEGDKKNTLIYKNTSGTIGSALFADKNLLLDFDYSLFFVSNDVSKLKVKGYDLKEFIKLPYTRYKHGIILKVNTEFGEIRLALDTGCTVNFLRSSFASHIKPVGKRFGLPFITTSTFEMGGKDFGPMNLYPYDISSDLSDMDGMLGMDFLIDHVVYIDRDHQQIYIQKSKDLPEMPITANIPYSSFNNVVSKYMNASFLSKILKSSN